MEEKTKEPYRVLLQGGEGEIVEKKSRFIATIGKAETEEEAVSFIEEVKKKYWDARHNCSAFVIGSKAQLTRCSDDGEPSKTAGRPMLEVLLGEEIRNIVAVVTRYFGGTLLGTGGLVRAYTQAVKEGLKNCQIGIMRYGCEITIKTDYNFIGRIQYLLGQRQIEPIESIYTEVVELKIRIPIETAAELEKAIIEATNAKASFIKTRELSFIDKNLTND